MYECRRPRRVLWKSDPGTKQETGTGLKIASSFIYFMATNIKKHSSESGFGISSGELREGLFAEVEKALRREH